LTKIINLWGSTGANYYTDDTTGAAFTFTGSGVTESLLLSQVSVGANATVAPLRIIASTASQVVLSVSGVFISTASINVAASATAFVIPVLTLRALLVIIDEKVREFGGKLFESIPSLARGVETMYELTLQKVKDIVRTPMRIGELSRNNLILVNKMNKKICTVCNKEFSKPSRRGYKQWVKQKTCSYKCYYGRTVSKETKLRMSIAHKGKPNAGYFTKERVTTLEWRQKLSRAGKGKKKTKEHIRKILQRRTFSNLELKFQSFIDKYNLPYKFVGNGNFFIENINPDFVNTNGQEKAIEVYYQKHKEMFRNKSINEWRRERSNIFQRYGWDILFIEAKELSEKYILETFVKN